MINNLGGSDSEGDDDDDDDDDDVSLSPRLAFLSGLHRYLKTIRYLVEIIFFGDRVVRVDRQPWRCSKKYLHDFDPNYKNVFKITKIIV